MERKIKIGVSSCLLGEPVRYDGGHKLDRFLTDTLVQHVEYVPVCPEVEAGLGVPREPMRLIGDPLSPRLVTVSTRRDLTDRMIRWATRKVTELEKEDLCGFIFKSKSPSSGMEKVKVYTNGRSAKKGVGIFAKAFMEHFPLALAEDEARLHDPGLRGNFIETILTLSRWRDSLRRGTVDDLLEFHEMHSLLPRSHSPVLFREMGKLAAGAKTIPLKDLYPAYEAMLMKSLKMTVSRNM